MTEVPEEAIWVVVGAIVVEGIALAIITYLIWRSSQRQEAGRPSYEAPPEPSPEDKKK